MLWDSVLLWATRSLLGIAALLVLLGLVGWRRGRRLSRDHCPGPPRRWYHRLRPRRWFFRTGCWYNLTGLTPDEAGAVCCPECGTVSLPHRRLRGGRRWRPIVFAVLPFGLAFGGVAFGWVASGRWTASAPTPALILFEYGPAARRLTSVLDELSRRVGAGEVGPIFGRWHAARLAADLDGTQPTLEQRAKADLALLWPISRRALESLLAGPDPEARAYAADLLRDYCKLDPPALLLEASLEDLGRDRAFSDAQSRRAAAFFCVRPDRAGPYLSRGMKSDDPQRRLLCAAIAGDCGLNALLPDAAPILLEHIRTDRITANERIAAPALYRFGPSVLPWLERACADEDELRRAIALSIRERLQHPERAQDALQFPMPDLGIRIRDELVNLDIWSEVGALSGWPLVRGSTPARPQP